MDRRNFLKLLAAAPPAVYLAHSMMSGIEGAKTLKGKTLILFEMAGGYDGLNLFIPQDEYDLYKKFRPTIHEPLKNTVPIGANTLLNQTLLGDLEELFFIGEMAVFKGVGYPNHNLSHFKSRDVWDYGIEIDSENIDSGWAARVLPEINRKAFMASVLDNRAEIFNGARYGVLNYQKPFDFFSSDSANNETINRFNKDLKKVSSKDHFIKEKNQIKGILKKYGGKFQKVTPVSPFPEDLFKSQFEQILQLMSMSEKDRPFIIKAGYDRYDTHKDQRGSDWLFSGMARNLANLASSLKALGVWDDCLIYCYTEFGRTPFENGSGGTEHNGANNLFALGGAINGGVYGEYPSLINCDKEKIMVGNLDFRSIYGSILEDFFGIKNQIFENASVDISPLRFLR